MLACLVDEWYVDAQQGLSSRPWGVVLNTWLGDTAFCSPMELHWQAITSLCRLLSILERAGVLEVAVGLVNEWLVDV